MFYFFICEFFLEFVVCVFDFLVGSLDIVDVDVSMFEIMVGFNIVIVDFVFGVVFGVVVVCQFDEVFFVLEVFFVGDGVGGVVVEEVEVEFCVGEGEFFEEGEVEVVVEFDQGGCQWLLRIER